jgi:hypothetical protein
MVANRVPERVALRIQEPSVTHPGRGLLGVLGRVLACDRGALGYRLVAHVGVLWSGVFAIILRS